MKNFKIRRRKPRSMAAILQGFTPGESKTERRDLSGFSSLLSTHQRLTPLGQLIDKARPSLANWPHYSSGLGLRLEDNTLTLLVAHRLQEARLRQTIPSLLASLCEAGYDIHDIKIGFIAQDGVEIDDPDVLPVKRVRAEEVLAQTQRFKPSPRLRAAALIWGQLHTLTHPETQTAMAALAQAMTPPEVTELDLTREFLSARFQDTLDTLKSIKDEKLKIHQKLDEYPALNYEALASDHPAHRARAHTQAMRQRLLANRDELSLTQESLMQTLTFLSDWLQASDEDLHLLSWETIAIHTSALDLEITAPSPFEEPLTAPVSSPESVRRLEHTAHEVADPRLRRQLTELAKALAKSQTTPITLHTLRQHIENRLQEETLSESSRNLWQSALHATPSSDEEAAQLANWLESTTPPSATPLPASPYPSQEIEATPRTRPAPNLANAAQLWRQLPQYQSPNIRESMHALMLAMMPSDTTLSDVIRSVLMTSHEKLTSRLNQGKVSANDMPTYQTSLAFLESWLNATDEQLLTLEASLVYAHTRMLDEDNTTRIIKPEPEPVSPPRSTHQAVEDLQAQASRVKSTSLRRILNDLSTALEKSLETSKSNTP